MNQGNKPIQRGMCGACKGYFALTRDGKMRAHGYDKRQPFIRCEGSGKAPVDILMRGPNGPIRLGRSRISGVCVMCHKSPFPPRYMPRVQISPTYKYQQELIASCA